MIKTVEITKMSPTRFSFFFNCIISSKTPARIHLTMENTCKNKTRVTVSTGKSKCVEQTYTARYKNTLTFICMSGVWGWGMMGVQSCHVLDVQWFDSRFRSLAD